MNTTFVAKVEAVVGPTLSSHGFVLDDSYTGSDEGGRELSIAYYRNAECKLQIYQWAREGETNCMIGLLDAPNEFGLLSKTKRWQFLTRFVRRPDLPLAELAEQARLELESFADPLEWVNDRIQRYYEVALAGMTAKYGNASDGTG